jgi:hypothetical protein
MSEQEVNYIAVCTPARDMVHANYTFCLVNMVAYHTINTPDAVALKINQGTLIQNQRADLCLEAMREGCTHVLFIDSDMTFPQDMVERLMAHDKDIVATNCARRRMPTGPTAQKTLPDGSRELIYTMPESTGLEEVESIGMGVMLIKRNVFESLTEPWFETPWRTDKRGYIGEDVFFCRKAAAAGFKIYIDHDVSKEIGHIGTFEFKHDHTWVMRDLEKAKEAS